MPAENSEKAEFPYGAWWRALQDIVSSPPPDSVPDPPVEVLPWLCIAPMSSVHVEILQQHGITHVLSTNRMVPSQVEELYWQLRSEGIDHCYVAAIDNLQYDMMGSHWSECRDFLSPIANDGKSKVLVHCAAGMNRSGTIVAAALMEWGQFHLLDAIRLLKEKRGQVMTNVAFQKQLVKFAASIGRLGDKPAGYLDDVRVEDKLEANEKASPEWLEAYKRVDEK